MDFKGFIDGSGLKVLAMSRLSACEYSVFIYLLNCAASGLNEFITTERELASLMGFSEAEIVAASTSLRDKRMVVMRYGDKLTPHPHRQSLRIGVNFDTKEWVLGFDDEVTSHDAIVYPFKRGSNLSLVDNSETAPSLPKGNEATWRRVFDSFIGGRHLTDSEQDKAKRDAQILIETHPVDQVLLMLRHFHQRIPTLSLLASSWQHYQELFEDEVQKVDLQDARQKHLELDERLRESVSRALEQQEDLGLSGEEVRVLDILFNHRHPRRQLFWAYQARSRYENLGEFFAENARLMLPVTTSGTVIKKRPLLDY